MQKASRRRSPLETEVLLFVDLQMMSGLTQPLDVKRWATKQGIRYGHDGSGGIWTTVTALNAALGITEPSQEKLSVDDVFG